MTVLTLVDLNSDHVPLQTVQGHMDFWKSIHGSSLYLFICAASWSSPNSIR